MLLFLHLISLSVQSRSGPEFLGLSRCAACYNQKAGSMCRRGGDGESSSSAEDSGPEVDSESEAESSSSSSCSGEASSEILENPSPVSGDAAEPESGDGQEETGVTRRAPLVKSFSLPNSFSPHLSPLSLLPRPHTVVSTLRLQVLSQKHDAADALCIVKQHLPEREEQKTGGSNGGGRGGINNLLPPQTGLPWQQPTSQQHQLSHQQPPHFPPLSAQGQRSPPSLRTLPMFHPPTLYTHPLQAPNAPQTHLHALTPQPCWYCYGLHFPPSPYWSHYSNGQFPR